MLTLFFDFFTHNPAYFVGVIFLLGLTFGSFFNVVIYRLPVIMQLEWLDNCRDFIKEAYGEVPTALQSNPEKLPKPPFTLAKPDSRCPACGHKIRWYENVPVVSYIALQGKCSGCKKAISLRYPVIEIATGVLSAWIACYFGVSWVTAAGLVLTWALICLTMIDFDHKLLPDQLTLPLLWLGILLNSQSMFVSLNDAVIGAVAGYLSLWSIYWLFKLTTGKEGMGYGDFKLLAALGAWMGWQSLLMIIILSSFVGAIVGITLIMVLGRDRNIPIPFGPYLAAAGWIAFMWGPELSQAYQDYLL